MAGGNLLARLAHTYSSGAQLQFQVYYDGTYRKVPRQFSEHRDTVDLDCDRTSLPGRQDLIVGAGYQLTRGHAAPALCCFAPETRTSPLSNVFVQDEIALGPEPLCRHPRVQVRAQRLHRLRISADAAGALDAARLGYGVGAISRAVRMPTRFDTDLRFTGTAPIVVLRGDDGFVSELVLSRELGYRHRFGSAVSMDLATFYNTYNNLRTQEPTLPTGIPIVLRNNMTATTSGIEVTASTSRRPRYGCMPATPCCPNSFASSPAASIDSGHVRARRSETSGLDARVRRFAAGPGERRRLPVRRRASTTPLFPPTPS